MILHFSADTKKITLLAHVWLPWASLGGKPSKKSLKAHKTCSCFRVEEWAGYSCYPAKPVSGQRTLDGRWSAGEGHLPAGRGCLQNGFAHLQDSAGYRLAKGHPASEQNQQIPSRITDSGYWPAGKDSSTRMILA